MKHINTEPNENDLQAYVDGNLSAAKSEEIAQYLKQHPLEAKRVKDFQKQNNLLQTLYGHTDKALLQRVMENHKKSKSKRIRSFISLSYVASVAWLIMGVFIGLGFNYVNVPEQSIAFDLPQSAMTAHVVFSPEVRHPVEVKADQEAHLVKWLSKRLNRNLKIPNLNSIGYELVGGRLLPAQVGPAAQFMYESSNGERLTLYVIAQHAKDTAFQFFERNKINVFSWNDTDMGFAIVGSINKEQLLEAANKIYGDLII